MWRIAHEMAEALATRTLARALAATLGAIVAAATARVDAARARAALRTHVRRHALERWALASQRSGHVRWAALAGAFLHLRQRVRARLRTCRQARDRDQAAGNHALGRSSGRAARDARAALVAWRAMAGRGKPADGLLGRGAGVAPAGGAAPASAEPATDFHSLLRRFDGDNAQRALRRAAPVRAGTHLLASRRLPHTGEGLAFRTWALDARRRALRRARAPDESRRLRGARLGAWASASRLRRLGRLEAQTRAWAARLRWTAVALRHAWRRILVDARARQRLRARSGEWGAQRLSKGTAPFPGTAVMALVRWGFYSRGRRWRERREGDGGRRQQLALRRMLRVGRAAAVRATAARAVQRMAGRVRAAAV